MTATQHRFEVPRDPTGVKSARDEMCDVLREWGLDDYTDDLRLCVSELVTNALRHSEGLVRVQLSCADRQLRCEIHDESPLPPHQRPVNTTGSGGRGLRLVQGVVEERGGAWGVRRIPGRVGKAVFVELPLPRPAAPAPVDGTELTAMDVLDSVEQCGS